jgi:hypothetical protein
LTIDIGPPIRSACTRRAHPVVVASRLLDEIRASASRFSTGGSGGGWLPRSSRKRDAARTTKFDS